MAFAPDAGGVLAALSGLALVALGLAVALARPRRAASAAFSAFAALWGLQVAASNVAAMATDAPTAGPWVLAFVALVVPLHLPLLVFVSAYPWPSNALARRPVALALAALPSVLLLLLLAVDPVLFVEGIEAGPDGAFPVPGPLFLPVALANSVLAFALALLLVARKLLDAEGAAAREQLGLVTAALLAYVAFRGGEVARFAFPGQWVFLPGDPLALGLTLATPLAAAAAALLVVLRVRARRDLPWQDLLLACGAAPFAVGALEWALLEADVLLSTVGLWRLVMVGLFAYAIARYRLFDLELRLREAAPAVAYLAIVGAGLAALWGLGGDLVARHLPLVVLASVGLAAAAAPVLRMVDGLMGRAAPHVREPEYLYKRKIDVYRAALEEAQAGGAGAATEEAFLSDLRRRLGISEQEHRVLLLVLRSQERYGPRRAAPGEGRFEVERELGRGAFGRAVLARDRRLERRVVLKQPLLPSLADPDGKARFLQEARLAARIQHPNVVAVHEVLPDEEPPVLVLEYVDGGSLADALRAGPLPLPRAVRLGLDVLAGLERIHAEGIVHRDLKPANILLARDGTAKVTDFGIARPPPSLAGAPTLAVAGAQPGSLAYMSPEQARGEELDARSDLYSTGAVLHEVLTGEHYLGRPARPAEMTARIEQAMPSPDPRIPPALAAFLAKALAKDPAARFPTARAMRQALAAAAGAPAVLADGPT